MFIIIIIILAYLPADVGWVGQFRTGNAHTPTNEEADGTTWRNPYEASAPDAWLPVGLVL